MELGSVAHRDHDLAAVVVEAAVGRHEGCGGLAWQGGGGLGGCEGEKVREEGCGEQTAAEQVRGHMILFPFHGEDRRDASCRSCLGTVSEC